MLYCACIIDVGWYYLSKLQTLSHDSLFEHGAEVLGISRTSLVQSYHMVKHAKTSSSLRKSLREVLFILPGGATDTVNTAEECDFFGMCIIKI